MADHDRIAENRLLAALPVNVRERLQPELELVHLAVGKVLYEAHDALSHVYFPTTAIVSLLYTMENGSTAEMGIVGCDGVVGIAVFMGGDTTPNRAVVQSAGDAFRLALKPFRVEFQRTGELHRLLLLYTQALLTQMSQTAVCNRLHSVEQRLCRCLLLSHDRLESDELIMTQELIASMLGVRREGVSVAAHRLQDAGLIRYKRGHITIVDRSGLESAVCECYQVVKIECDRLLPYQPNPSGSGISD
ncbi:MAG: Crp/Fnr family transcriptional regulator [Gammaproteobacteria bacterium]|nr:Crp/Fnr family transcriptional regulator [Gammaproteobacteria bacterium]